MYNVLVELVNEEKFMSTVFALLASVDPETAVTIDLFSSWDSAWAERERILQMIEAKSGDFLEFVSFEDFEVVPWEVK